MTLIAARPRRLGKKEIARRNAKVRKQETRELWEFTGNVVVARLGELRITKEEFARRIGCAGSLISRYERGNAGMSVGGYLVAAKALGLRAYDLLPPEFRVKTGRVPRVVLPERPNDSDLYASRQRQELSKGTRWVQAFTAAVVIVVREERGLTLTEAAKRTSVSRQMWSLMEHGAGVHLARYPSIAKALGLGALDLLPEEFSK